MYTGNGAAKKFRIPEGYDGSVVVLGLPTGKTIKMKAGEGYEIAGEYVIFDAVIPSGITISFEEDEDSEPLITSGYVVIYGDGTIQEVNEDPVKYLEETQKILSEAKKQTASINEISERTVERIKSLGEDTANKYESELYKYEQRAESMMNETVSLLRAEMRTEAEIILSQVTEALSQINAGLSRMEDIREETRGISAESARETEERIIKDCERILEAYEEIAEIKIEIKRLADEAKYAADSAGREASALMNSKVNEEIEMLRSLRLKLEDDSELLMTKINNAWEVLRGELNGGK